MLFLPTNTVSYAVRGLARQSVCYIGEIAIDHCGRLQESGGTEDREQLLLKIEPRWGASKTVQHTCRRFATLASGIAVNWDLHPRLSPAIASRLNVCHRFAIGGGYLRC